MGSGTAAVALGIPAGEGAHDSRSESEKCQVPDRDSGLETFAGADHANARPSHRAIDPMTRRMKRSAGDLHLAGTERAVLDVIHVNDETVRVGVSLGDEHSPAA